MRILSVYLIPSTEFFLLANYSINRTAELYQFSKLKRQNLKICHSHGRTFLEFAGDSSD